MKQTVLVLAAALVVSLTTRASANSPPVVHEPEVALQSAHELKVIKGMDELAGPIGGALIRFGIGAGCSNRASPGGSASWHRTRAPAEECQDAAHALARMSFTPRASPRASPTHTIIRDQAAWSIQYPFHRRMS